MDTKIETLKKDRTNILIEIQKERKKENKEEEIIKHYSIIPFYK